jgi:Flp pilus assembly protein TadG
MPRCVPLAGDRGFGVSGWCRFWTGQGDGSSLIETALVMPVLILMLCFAVDIGYFFIVAANLVSSSRNAVLYSGQGFTSPAQQSLPSAGTTGSLSDTAGVAGLAGGDLSGLANMATLTTVEVCSKAIGVTQTSNGYITNCSTFPSGSLNYTPDQDPESANGMLTQRVDVVYTVSPPIPINFFTFAMPPLTIHWQAEMRAVD